MLRGRRLWLMGGGWRGRWGGFGGGEGRVEFGGGGGRVEWGGGGMCFFNKD